MANLRKWLLLSSPDFAEARIRQRLIVYTLASFCGIGVMIPFGLVLTFFGGSRIIATTDFIAAGLLGSAYIFMRRTKKLNSACMMAGLVMLGFLLVHIITGGTDFSGPVWHFTYPPLAMYLLGPRLGLILSLIAIAPALYLMIAPLAGWTSVGYPAAFF